MHVHLRSVVSSLSRKQSNANGPPHFHREAFLLRLGVVFILNWFPVSVGGCGEIGLVCSFLEKWETALHIHMAKGCRITEGQANPSLTQNKSGGIKKFKNLTLWDGYCFAVINGNCHFLKYLLCQANTYFFLFFKKFVEMQLVYNVVLISAAQQSNAGIHIYMLFFIFFSIMVYHRLLNTISCAIQ